MAITWNHSLTLCFLSFVKKSIVFSLNPAKVVDDDEEEAALFVGLFDLDAAGLEMGRTLLFSVFGGIVRLYSLLCALSVCVKAPEQRWKQQEQRRRNAAGGSLFAWNPSSNKNPKVATIIVP